MAVRIGIDVGGTFTDICVYDGDSLRLDTYKVPTTPADPGEAIGQGLEEAARDLGQPLPQLLTDTELVVYGTTVATNAVLTGRVGKVGLLCTAGFRDVLAIREGTKADVFDYDVDFPSPYVPRKLTLPVTERISPEGDVVVPLQADDVTRALQIFEREEVEIVAIAFLWSIINPSHERAARELVQDVWPGVSCVVSHEVNPVPREYRRTIATVIDASLHRVVRPHLQSVERMLVEAGLGEGRLLIASSGGGVMSVDEMMARPIYTVGSGPTMAPIGGRVATDQATRSIGESQNLLVVDMGGTSFDISLVHDGRVAASRETRVGADLLGISRVDIHSIGAGGGSIAHVDEGGVLHVGPSSAGAVPGPACYGRGGTQPTVSDADLLLGYLDPAGLVGGELPLDISASHAAMADVAETLGSDLTSAAYAVFSTVNQNMVNGIEAVTVRQGVDPAETTLVAGGGACGVHVAAIAGELGIGRVIIPGHAGALSAWGTLVSDISHEFSTSRLLRSDAPDLEGVNGVLGNLVDQARVFLTSTGTSESSWEIAGLCEARYVAQIWELDAPLPGLSLGEADFAHLLGAFHEIHQRTYGFAEADQVVEFLQWRVRGTARIQTPEVRERVEAVRKQQRRAAYFGDDGLLDSAVVSAGAAKRQGEINGPSIVQEVTTTILVPPRWRLEAIEGGSYLLTSQEETSPQSASRRPGAALGSS